MMDLVPAPVACAYGASVMKKHLDAMRREFDGVRHGDEDIEYIHRLRVATRRMRSAMTLFGGCYEVRDVNAWQKHIRTLTRSLGAARDLDVQLEFLSTFLANLPEKKYRPGVQRIILRQSQRRRRLQMNVVQALDELTCDGTLEYIEAKISKYQYQLDFVPPYTIDLYYLAEDAVEARLDDFLQYHDCINHPEQVSELHRMRIVAKHLRYTLEALDPIFEGRLKSFIRSTRQAQDMLGIIHDCDMWAIWIPRFVEKERQRISKFYGHLRAFSSLRSGIEYFSQDRQQERERMFQKFKKQWEEWQKKDLWGRLLKAVSVNFIDTGKGEVFVEKPVEDETEAED